MKTSSVISHSIGSTVVVGILFLGLIVGCVTVDEDLTADKGAPHGKILMKGPGRNDKDPSSSACANFNLNEEQVRHIFQTYRRIDRKELHHKYTVSPCYVDGLIETRKAVYPWRVRAANTLETSYPNGKESWFAGPSESKP